MASQVPMTKDLIDTGSTAGDATNDTNGFHYPNRKLGHMRGKEEYVTGNISGIQSDDGVRNLVKKINTIGNSIGGQKMSLNISQNFADSTNEISLAKTGKINHLNLTSLLKSNLLDEDGIEDVHFYFVSFNHHKTQILKMHEQKEMMKAKGVKNPLVKGYTSKVDEISSDKTIESVEEEDLY